MASGHRITIAPSNRRVEVSIRGVKLASSGRPVILSETGLPDRYYLPREDVRTDLLQRTGTLTACPYKGQACYWSAQAGSEVYQDVAWSYETPVRSAAGIAGLLCFYPDRVELTVDGERQPGRPMPVSHP